MKRIYILVFENTVASTFTGPLDVFHQAGRLYSRLLGGQEEPLFEVKIVGLDGRPFDTRTGLRVVPHLGIQEATEADLVLVSAVGSLNPERYPGAVEWLRHHANRGADVASVCTGAFLLAATGLLDGRKATTHWGFLDEFRRRFPAVDLCPERILTDEGPILCSAGFSAAVDLSLYLVERYCGREVALGCAKAMLYDLGRTHQAPYSVYRFRKDHGDTATLEVQTWLEGHYAEPIAYAELAPRFAMGRRTLERRFNGATGVTPLRYLQQLRVEAAKRLLEETRLGFGQITWRVGYGDGGFFRRLFQKEVGLTPAAYRERFTRAKGGSSPVPHEETR